MARKFQCPSCKQSIVVSRVVEPGKEIKCRYCGAALTVPDEAHAATRAEHDQYLRPHIDPPRAPGASANTGDFGASAAGAVGGLAWFVLVIHIIAAIVIWSTTGTAEVVDRIWGISRTAANPVGVSLGFIVLLEGIFFCIVLRCLHWIGRNVADLRRSSGTRPN